MASRTISLCFADVNAIAAIPRSLDAKQRSCVIPLRSAVLCVNCENVTDSSGEKCKACSGGPLLSLGKVLNGRSEFKVSAGTLEGSERIHGSQQSKDGNSQD